MLSQLYIKNIAVIHEVTIEFDRGFNVFTGETGAGKTILIHAINAVLGERASKEMIRTGEEKAEIAALFTDLSEAAKLVFDQAGYPCEDGCVLIGREITSDGRTTCRINGRPANVSILKMVCESLLHIHGQHDNRKLLSTQQHLFFIDQFGDLEILRKEYESAYREWEQIRQD